LKSLILRLFILHKYMGLGAGYLVVVSSRLEPSWFAYFFFARWAWSI